MSNGKAIMIRWVAGFIKKISYIKISSRPYSHKKQGKS